MRSDLEVFKVLVVDEVKILVSEVHLITFPLGTPVSPGDQTPVHVFLCKGTFIYCICA